MSLSLTLAVLKPDLVLHPMHLAAVRRAILESKFWVVRSALVTLSKDQAGAFYAEHEGKFFHQRLVEHMTSGPCQPLILAKVNAIQDWRSLMGPTKVFQARYSLSILPENEHLSTIHQVFSAVIPTRPVWSDRHTKLLPWLRL